MTSLHSTAFNANGAMEQPSTVPAVERQRVDVTVSEVAASNNERQPSHTVLPSLCPRLPQGPECGLFCRASV